MKTSRSQPEFRNGVPRPNPGTVNRQIWDISDQLYSQKIPKLRKAVLERCNEQGINLNTASVEHCIWRRFNGLVKPKERDMSSALVILSGGQDSTTALFWAKQQFGAVHAITFDYGQRHQLEIESARKVAKMAACETHEVLSVKECLKSASPLTSSNELERYDNYEQMDKVIGNRVEVTFVPMRNTFFFTIAMNRAVALGVKNLVTGICQEDNANYPDCTERFRTAYEHMANESLGLNQSKERFTVWAPLMYKSKGETVKLAKELPGAWEALAYTHTSYDGKYPPIDPNHANVLRAHGFEIANEPDPLVVRAWTEGLMDLPSTPNYDAIRDARP